jgi:hypothetical protein
MLKVEIGLLFYLRNRFNGIDSGVAHDFHEIENILLATLSN